MSNILVIVEPAEGHFNPLAPIIRKFVDRGHTVRCLTGRVYRGRVESLGAMFIPLPAHWDVGDQEVYDFFPALKSLKGLAQIKFYIKHVMYDQVPDMLKALESVLADFKADLIMGDSFMVAGTWLRELGGPPSVRLSVLPLSLPGKDLAPFGLGLMPGSTYISKFRNNLLNRLFEDVLFKDVQQHVNQLRHKVGLPAYDKNLFISAVESPDLVLHTSTPLFEYPRLTFPANFRFIGPVVLPTKPDFQPPDWWQEIEHSRNKPVILVNQGTVARNCNDLIVPAVDALKHENVWVVAVSVTENADFASIGNLRTAPYIPFGNLLPLVDVMVTNGGFGAVQNALAHGIPLVIAGATEDKMEVAARVEYAGAGINLRTKQPTAAEIRTAVMKILSDPSFKNNALKLKNDFHQYDAPVLALEFVEELLTRSSHADN